MKPKLILCPVDFSTESAAALQAATELAGAGGARLLLLHVHQVPALLAPEPMVIAELIQQALAAAEKNLAEWEREAVARGAARVEARLVEGVPWDRIVAVAREVGCDLIVIATHGRTGLRHALLGSVAERVVRHAPCSVLVVKEGAPTP